MLSHFGRVQLFATLWTVALQAPLSMGFFRQEYWSAWPCPLAGGLPDPGIETAPLILWKSELKKILYLSSLFHKM